MLPNNPLMLYFRLKEPGLKKLEEENLSIFGLLFDPKFLISARKLTSRKLTNAKTFVTCMI